jgi:hypothetical protein
MAGEQSFELTVPFLESDYWLELRLLALDKIAHL